MLEGLKSGQRIQTPVDDSTKPRSDSLVDMSISSTGRQPVERSATVKTGEPVNSLPPELQPEKLSDLNLARLNRAFNQASKEGNENSSRRPLTGDERLDNALNNLTRAQLETLASGCQTKLAARFVPILGVMEKLEPRKVQELAKHVVDQLSNVPSSASPIRKNLLKFVIGPPLKAVFSRSSNSSAAFIRSVVRENKAVEASCAADLLLGW